MNRQNPIPPGEPAQAACRQRGSIVVYLAITLVVFGVLAMAGAGRFGSSILGVSAPNCATQARLMAESGVRYATARLRTATSQATLTAMIATLNGQTLTVDATRGLSFTLTVTASGTGNALVSSLGSACGGAIFLPTTTTLAQASVNVPAAGGGGGGGTPGEGINFARDIASFATTPGFSGQAGITVNVAAGTISLGNALYANSASVWYTGNRDVCSAGNCTLGNGLCAYFEYEFTSGSTGDGFVWTLMSGDTNTNASNGGDTGRGELMGYGGLGSSGLGIQAPKFGVEFDIYNNGCAASACTVGSRCDSNVRDHVAQIFWGAQTVSGCNTTYDDNRHAAGAGNASEPRNSSDIDSTTGYDGYYYRTTSNDWMKTGGKFLYRFELDRSTTVNAEGNYCYQVRSWVKKPTDTFPAGLSNCTIAYSGPPDLTSVVNLTPAMHQKLNKVFFGWTEGTGGATQLATLSNFSLYYKAAPTVPIVPQDYVSGWSMYEATGTAVHDMNATNHNDGTIAGTGQWVPGIGCPNCSALRFSANNDRVTVPDAANLRLSAAGSISCWVNIQGAPDWAGLVHKGSNASFNDEAYSLQFTSGRNVALILTNAGGTALWSNTISLPNNNQWYHVAATWDAGNVKLYLNGALGSTTANTIGAVMTAPTGNLILGAQLPTNYGITGIIDEVYLYNRALTATEIANMALGHP